MTSNMRTNHCFLNTALSPLTVIPMLMWKTPMITEVLILMELKKVRELGSKYQEGSVPKG